MKTAYLTTRNLDCAIKFYQQHLHAIVLSQSALSAELHLTEHQLLLVLKLTGEKLGSHDAERRISLTPQLLGKMTTEPGIFYRQFLSPRPADSNQLPVELQDCDGHRWQIYWQPGEAH
jgi:hypothetical protein